jgi:hypothetical protein
MPEVRALVPLEYENRVIQPDEVVDVSVEQAEAWRAMGKVTLITTEQTLAAAASEGNYSSVIGREDVGQVSVATSHPGPQASDDDDDEEEPPRSRRSRR